MWRIAPTTAVHVSVTKGFRCIDRRKFYLPSQLVFKFRQPSLTHRLGDLAWNVG